MENKKNDRKELLGKIRDFQIEESEERIRLKKEYKEGKISYNDFCVLKKKATELFLDKLHKEGDKYEFEIYDSITVGEISDEVEKKRPGLLNKAI